MSGVVRVAIVDVPVAQADMWICARLTELGYGGDYRIVDAKPSRHSGDFASFIVEASR